MCLDSDSQALPSFLSMEATGPPKAAWCRGLTARSPSSNQFPLPSCSVTWHVPYSLWASVSHL